ncbi:hypothetical protein HALLA_14845 [Halostagnicola larsenii XH-48]|uniref:DUF7344 domain-containing protein n=1 Tax=Halostagnicola larsenii XH-48 TaxID=797299 RepID=W0JSD3_9EURY|nr:hypothetical protein [Halostagnicola larsenii]AHF99877.1 hypothetical protein HALLA_14845 [Halostagnicola larsenii XH-48]
MSDATGELDTVLELCRVEHRRIVLAILLKDRRALTLNDLTKEIVRHNHRMSITDVPSETVSRIHLSVVHQHVPKLADAKVITYDRERQLVEPTDRLDGLESSLSTIIGLDSDLDILDTG